MKTYQVPLTIKAIASIKADSEAEAMALAEMQVKAITDLKDIEAEAEKPTDYVFEFYGELA